MLKLKQRKDAGRFLPLLFGSLFSLVMLLVISFIMACIAFTSEDPTSKLPMFSLLALLLSAAVGGYINARVILKSPTASMLSSLFASLALLVFAIIFGKGGSGAFYMNMLSYILVSLFFIFLGSRKPLSQRRRRHKR